MEYVKIAIPNDAALIVHGLMRVQNVLIEHETRSAPNVAPRWRTKSSSDHALVALGHIVSHLRGRRDEDHLAHAACRVLFAIAVTAPGVQV